MIEGIGTADEVATVLVTRCRRAVVISAEGRLDEFLDVVASAILDELTEYGKGRSVGDLDDIRSGVRRSIELCLWAIGEGRRLDADELTAMRFTGGQRARQGIPKATVLASVRIGTRVGRDFLMTCGDVEEDAETLIAAFREITDLLDRFEDDATAAMAEGWDEAYRGVLTGGDRGEAVLVDRLLECRFHDEADVLRHAEEIGLLPSREAHVVVVTSQRAADERRLHDATARVRRRVLLAAGPVRSANRMHLPLIVQPGQVAWEELVSALDRIGRDTSTVLVASEQAVRLTAVSSMYREMRTGLPFLPAATSRAGVLPAVILRFHRALFGGSATDRLELLHDLLGPLEEQPSKEVAELLEILEALYEVGGSTAAVARHVHLHKNTVGNRFRRLRDLTGLDVRQPRERLVLETMLRMRCIMESTLQLPESPEWPAARTG